MVRNWVDQSVIHVIFVAQVGFAVLADPSVYLLFTVRVKIQINL